MANSVADDFCAHCGGVIALFLGRWYHRCYHMWTARCTTYLAYWANMDEGAVKLTHPELVGCLAEPRAGGIEIEI